MMKNQHISKSTRIEEIPNSFSPKPLSGRDLDIYYKDTIEVRTADAYSSPIEDIYDSCTSFTEDNIFILMGHTGSGKSTELNKMSERLRNEGYKVYTVNCLNDLGMNFLYTDLLILMGEALISIANEMECTFDTTLGKSILEFWNTEITCIGDSTKEYAIDIETGAELDTPSIFGKIFDFFAKIKAGIKLKQTDAIEYKKVIERRSEAWYVAIDKIADLITETLRGKRPIIIFEDLDKLDRVNPELVWDMFSLHAANLSHFSFPVIYTFPISLSYDPRFGTLSGYFTDKTFPMIELQYSDGSPCDNGKKSIERIILSRAEEDLFDENALDIMIEKTGGSLRDLFSVIRDASIRARRRGSKKIEKEDTRIALNTLQSSLTRRIETKNYEFLTSIVRGNTRNIEDRRMLLEMLTANVVMEYNSNRWHDVHPLVKDFLEETGQLKG